MNRKSVIQQIALRLLNEELLNVSDFENVDDVTDMVTKIIEKELDGIELVKGRVI